MASASVQHGQADLLQHGDGDGIDEPAVASDGAPNIALEQRQQKKASRATEPISEPAQNGDAHASEDGLSSERGEQGPASPWHRQQISIHTACGTAMVLKVAAPMCGERCQLACLLHVLAGRPDQVPSKLLADHCAADNQSTTIHLLRI